MGADPPYRMGRVHTPHPNQNLLLKTNWGTNEVLKLRAIPQDSKILVKYGEHFFINANNILFFFSSYYSIYP